MALVFILVPVLALTRPMVVATLSLCSLALSAPVQLSQAEFIASRLAPFDLQLSSFAETGGRGIATTRDRSAGEQIMEVKDELIFSTHRELPRWPTLMAAVERQAAVNKPFGDEHILPMLLLLSRFAGGEDPWSHFIDSLPHPQQPSPLSATSAELALLPRCYAALACSVDAYARSLHAECEPLTAALAAAGMWLYKRKTSSNPAAATSDEIDTKEQEND